MRLIIFRAPHPYRVGDENLVPQNPAKPRLGGTMLWKFQKVGRCHFGFNKVGPYDRYKWAYNPYFRRVTFPPQANPCIFSAMCRGYITPMAYLGRCHLISSLLFVFRCAMKKTLVV